MANNNRGQSKGGSGGDGGPREDKNIAFAINSLHGTYKSSSDKNDKHQDNQFLWTRRTAVAAILYTVITGALLGAGIWSAIQASNAVTEAARAVGEAKRSADAAQDQVTTAKDTEQRQLRAYVGLIPGDIENFGDPKNQRFTFHRKNYGATPAYDVSIAEIGHGVIPYGAPVPILTPFPNSNIPRGNPTIFPNAELRFEVNGSQSSPADIQKLSVEPNLRFGYDGTVTYRDAFGHPHHTNFCWLFKFNDYAGKDADWCAGHNDSD